MDLRIQIYIHVFQRKAHGPSGVCETLLGGHDIFGNHNISLSLKT